MRSFVCRLGIFWLLASVGTIAQDKALASCLIPCPPNSYCPVRFERYRLGCGITPPQIVFAPAARFPKALQAKHGSEVIVLGVMLERSGAISSARVILPLQSPQLVKPVMEAVRGYRFRPATHKGRALEVVFTLRVRVSDGRPVLPL